MAEHNQNAVREVIEDLARAHQREDVDAYLSIFDPESVWVTSRGRCISGRVDLDIYLRQVIPDGLGTGSVTYTVQSVHIICQHTALATVELSYLGSDGEPHDNRARHIHTYVLAKRPGRWLILAGQDTVRHDI